MISEDSRLQGFDNGLELRLSATTLELEKECSQDCRFVVIMSLNQSNETYETYALLDTGCSGHMFMDLAHARAQKLPIYHLSRPRPLRAFDGTFTTPVTLYTRVAVNIKGHFEKSVFMFLTSLEHYPIIIGLPWLREHNPRIDWREFTMLFDSQYCQEHCCFGKPIVTGHTVVPLTHRKTRIIPHHRPETSTSVLRVKPMFTAITTEEPLPNRVTEVLEIEDSNDSGYESEIPKEKRSPASKRGQKQRKRRRRRSPPITPIKPLDVHCIGAAPFLFLAKRKKKNTLFTMNLRDLDLTLNPAPRLDLCTSTAEELRDRETQKKNIDPKTICPSEYHDLISVFDRSESKTLPSHRAHDHKIQLKEGAIAPAGPLYGMSRDELEVLRDYLKDNLSNGFIRASQSPASSPVMFVKKSDGGLRFCVDYRALNALTVKNRYPLPLINETLQRLSKAVVYTKLDIIAAFNRIRMAKGDEYLTAFACQFGLYEYNVMPFGLCNGPATFQSYINSTLGEYIHTFCTAYLDDILIYSESRDEHIQHVRLVLQRLLDAGLQADITKCEFHATEVQYLGLIVSTQGIRMDPKKVATVQYWETPKCIKDVQAFLGFANFYRRFIAKFSAVASPLTGLTKKSLVKFNWTDEAQSAFDQLKAEFIKQPVLAHFNPDLEIILETDASDYVAAGVLSQVGADGVLHPVAYFSAKHNPAECNYEIYDKELGAIVKAFELWRAELQGSRFPIQVVTDHKNLEYFMSTKNLSRRQARWSEYLSRFDFVIKYRPGSKGQKPDSLTRRSGDLPKEGDERIQYQFQTVLKERNLAPGVKPSPASPISLCPMHTTEDQEARSTLELWDASYEIDTWEQEILNLLRAPGTQHSRDVSLTECSKVNGHLYYRGRRFVPDYAPLRKRLIYLHHDILASGHKGRERTYEVLSRTYWWDGMMRDVAKYVRNCHLCSMIKSSREKYQGVLKPLPVPEHRNKHLSMDFIVDLPPSSYRGETVRNILVIVDRLSKKKRFIPCNEMSAEHIADLFYDNIWRHDGTPSTIVSDRGRNFVSAFFQRLCQRLGVEPRFSTAYHPSTDGQTENANQYLEQYLRAYVDYLQGDWAKYIPSAEFCANDTKSATTGVTPFFAEKGFHPTIGIEDPQPYPADLSSHLRMEHENADAYAEKLSLLQQHCREAMLWAQAWQEHYANQGRNPAPLYRVGSQVWLNAKNIQTTRPSDKLDYRNLGPFKVLKRIGNYAYRLDLPPQLSSVHPVFNTALLRPVADDPLEGQVNPPRDPIVADDGETEWASENILDSAFRHRRGTPRHSPPDLHYRILWSDGTQSWEPWDFITNMPESLNEFHRDHPAKPGPKTHDS